MDPVRPARFTKLTMLGAALLVAGLALLASGGWWAASITSADRRFLAGATLLPLGLLFGCLGGAALWQGYRQSVTGAASPCDVPSWPVLVAAWSLAVTGGLLLARRGAPWPFFIVAAAPPLVSGGLVARLALGAGEQARPRWLAAVAALAWGAIVAPLLAVAAELVAALGALSALLVGLAFGANEARAAVDTALQAIRQPAPGPDRITALLAILARQPAVLGAIVIVAVVAAPALEELFKFLGVILVTHRGTHSVYATTLIGLASGIGFAIVENIAYAAQAGAGGWLALTLFRGPTPLMHGASTALFALGWARQARHPAGWALVGGAAAAFGLHAAWNLAAALLAGAALAPPALVPVLGLLGLLLAFGISVGAAIFLARLGRRLARETVVEFGGARVAVAPPAGPSRPIARLLG